MTERPKIRVVIDHLVLSGEAASSEASARRDLGRGIAQALAQRGAFIRGNHSVVRVALTAEATSAHAAGVALGATLGGSAARASAADQGESPSAADLNGRGTVNTPAPSASGKGRGTA